MRELFPRLLNMPVKVEFAGWRSDTLTLQQNGWDVSVDQDIMYDLINFAFRHPSLGLYAYGRTTFFRFRECMRSPAQFEESLRDLVVPIVCIRSDIQTHFTTGVDFSKFSPVDAEPMFIDNQIKSIEDFGIFRTFDKSKEIIVEPATVNSLMQQILELQSPKQKEIREKLRKQRARESQGRNIDELKPVQQVHAQIITLAA